MMRESEGFFENAEFVDGKLVSGTFVTYKELAARRRAEELGRRLTALESKLDEVIALLRSLPQPPSG